MSGTVFRICFFLITMIFLTACHSTHKKEYSYVPPEDAGAKKCIAQCYTAKKHCEKLCRMRQQNCKTSTAKKMKNCRAACQCQPAFNTCYRACGGIVHGM